MEAPDIEYRSALGKRHRFSNTDYKIAFLVPLSVELAPIQAMLDTVHDDIPVGRDQNAYIFGSLGQHNVVIAILPSVGNNDSGVVANQLMNDFPAIRFGLLVGVGGGVPGQADIRLGDVVVSEPSGTTGGVLQFDRGKRYTSEGLQRTGHLNKPSPLLNATVKKLRAQHMQKGNQIRSLIQDMTRKNPGMKGKFDHPGIDTDNLYESNYKHIGGDTCQKCDSTKIVSRSLREDMEAEIHYGTIGSSNVVVKDADERDRLSREYNLLSVEMEAAGIMDTLPCLVIRGICDYADSHKNKRWQPYAAAAAAAYAKELLQVVPSDVPISPKTPTEERDQQYDALFTSLTFTRMDARLRNVSEAHPQTCKWLFGHEQFKSWFKRDRVEEHHGFFWIKGKPGSGKSTIMKATLKRAKRQWKQEIVLSYFFNARAPTELEKSSIGLYRSLAYQLLSECPQLQPSFLECFQYKNGEVDTGGWTVPELQEFFVNSIQHLQDRPLNVFIDALDEGDERDVRQMINFLEDLALSAKFLDFPLRICLSSRHFPHISIRRGISLVLEDQYGHEADLKTYICSKLVGDASAEIASLQDEVFQKSAKIFLWVVLVIPILNEAYDKGKSVKYISQRLQELPEKLDDLFTRIIAQSGEDIEECVTLLQWVLFSRRALSPVELDLALKSSGLSPWSEISSPERTARYLLNTSRGLTEITADPPIVQFIHETVREFLKQKGLAQTDTRLVGNIEGHSHEKIKSGCLQYLKLHASSIKGTSQSDRKQHRLQLMLSHPLLEYATAHLFDHANLAEGSGVSQQRFLRHLRGGVLLLFEAWIQARNALQPYITRTYSNDVSLLYAVVEQEQEDLVKVLINDNIDVNVKGERFGSPLQAACAAGSERIARLLLDAGADVNAEGGEFNHAIATALHFKKNTVIELLIQYHARPSATVLQACLHRTAARGYFFGVKKLLELGANANGRNRHGQSLLMSAFKRGHSAIVEALITAGAEVNTPGDHLLQAACVDGHDQIVQRLLQAGADINAQGGCYGSALQAACSNRHEHVAHILVEAEADVNAQGGHYGNALQTACRYESKQIVRLLLEAGADVNNQGGHYGNALQAACSNEHQEIARLLLEAGADVNAQGGHYGNALRAACSNGHEQIVRLLVKAGADVNAKGGHYGNALQTACRHENKQIVRLLLEAGADVNAQGEGYANALQVACTHRDEEIVRLLLEAGADVNAQGGHYGNALQAACSNGHEQIVRLLLEAGADVNAQGGFYGNALKAVYSCSITGTSPIVRMLKEAGAQ